MQSGDSWFAIAERAGVTGGALLSANGAQQNDLLVVGDVLCLPADADPTAACRAGKAATYTVRAGDGWFAIAKRAGISADALLTANGAGSDRAIHPGDTICMPAGVAAPSGGGSGSGNGGSGGQASGGATYQVVRGDSWFAIAERAGVTLNALLAANGATAKTVLKPGDTLQLPSSAKSPARANNAGGAGSQTVKLQAAPVQGPCGFGDTWQASRSGGRRHVGTDIFSRQGQYVYAVVSGTLTARSWDQPGKRSGNAWYLTAGDGSRTYYFYAHLADFAPGLEVGSRVRAGQIIGFMGETGNTDATHLHLEIHPGGGDPINPYPVLRAQGGCNQGAPYTQPGGWVPERLG